MKADIQKIFSQYGITNKMHNDAYDWMEKYWNIDGKINKKDDWKDGCFFLCIITFWCLLGFGLAFLNSGLSFFSKKDCIFLITLILLNLFFFFMVREENKRKEEYIRLCMLLNMEMPML